MARDVARDWMWSEACEMLARAERMHRELFRPAGSSARQPSWEPPVDILETESAVLALVALPGVDATSVEAAIDNGELVIAGTRVYPSELSTATFTGSNCRKAASTGGCDCRPAVTTPMCAAPSLTAVWS